MSFSQQSVEKGPYEMNASISQPISIELSPDLAAGILFTNGSTYDVQENITAMEWWNNATKNYPGGLDNTGYWIKAGAGNNVNLTVCHCACENLTCKQGLCTPGVHELIVACSNPGSPDDCVGFVNVTSSSQGGDPGDSPSYGFPGTLVNQVIAEVLEPGHYVNLRYWLNPSPDYAPSGVYNTTFKIYAVEEGYSCGTCSC